MIKPIFQKIAERRRPKKGGFRREERIYDGDDFQHHYISVELAKKRGLYAETGKTMLHEGGVPGTTMHQRLYDLDLQLRDMDEAGVDVSVCRVCSVGLRRSKNVVSSTTTLPGCKENIRGGLSV